MKFLRSSVDRGCYSSVAENKFQSFADNVIITFRFFFLSQ